MKQGYQINTVNYWAKITDFVIVCNYHNTNNVINYHHNSLINMIDSYTVAVFKIKPKTVK